ncbi:hypothetical protein KCX83_05265 [Brucella oryzae]|uniref:hypothetical protein n=1 Tax=Brucella oryzae TaxID=335286 RepID=UPI001B835AA2|nr:hypothetical protein [Brucella oryzae]MBR7651731.1 hypothetical protein [Brucella oryzae]
MSNVVSLDAVRARRRDPKTELLWILDSLVDAAAILREGKDGDAARDLILDAADDLLAYVKGL